MIGYLCHHWVVELPVIALPSHLLVTPPSRLLASPLIVLSLHRPLIVSLRRLVVVALPLGVPPSCPLVVLSLRRPLAVSSRHLVLHHLSSRCHFVLSLPSQCAALSLSNRAGWLLCRLSLHRRLAFSSRRTLVLLSSSHCTALLSSHRAIWLLRCLLLRRRLVLSSYSHSQRHLRHPQRWRSLSPATPDVERVIGVADVCLIEVGGTVGDIKSSVFLEALHQFQFHIVP